uniref:Uncharacterized protein n=1 Tax=Rangifer tarandus platyrhynchus TaxID=3082113 RepID=A0ACB0EHN6_RANTA|nr:unnamed protein product [Rangifer tarandus platyrhynchus]
MVGGSRLLGLLGEPGACLCSAAPVATSQERRPQAGRPETGRLAHAAPPPRAHAAPFYHGASLLVPCTCPGQALPAIRTPRPPGPQALGSNSSTFDMRSRPEQPASSLRVSVLKFTPEGSNSKLSPAPPLCQARHHSQRHAITLTTSIITSIHGVTTFINSIITVITNIITVISPCSSCVRGVGRAFPPEASARPGPREVPACSQHSTSVRLVLCLPGGHAKRPRVTVPFSCPNRPHKRDPNWSPSRTRRAGGTCPSLPLRKHSPSALKGHHELPEASFRSYMQEETQARGIKESRQGHTGWSWGVAPAHHVNPKAQLNSPQRVFKEHAMPQVELSGGRVGGDLSPSSQAQAAATLPSPRRRAGALRQTLCPPAREERGALHTLSLAVIRLREQTQEQTLVPVGPSARWGWELGSAPFTAVTPGLHPPQRHRDPPPASRSQAGSQGRSRAAGDPETVKGRRPVLLPSGAPGLCSLPLLPGVLQRPPHRLPGRELSSWGVEAGPDGHRGKECPGRRERLGTGTSWAEAPDRAGELRPRSRRPTSPSWLGKGWSGQADGQSRGAPGLAPGE